MFLPFEPTHSLKLSKIKRQSILTSPGKFELNV